MINYVNNSLEHYFKVLKSTGYCKYTDVGKLLVLIFLYKMVSGKLGIVLTREDKKVIGRGLECLFGTSCLTPYTRQTNMAYIFRTASDSSSSDNNNSGSGDTTELEKRVTELESKVSNFSSYSVVKGKNYIQVIPDLDLSDFDEVEGK